MKAYLAERTRLVAILTIGLVASFSLLTPVSLEAQAAPEKIRLMADALRARDSGNLTEAKAKAEELIKIAPEDENVQRLLASINRDLDRRSGSGSAPVAAPVFGQAPDASVEAAMIEGALEDAALTGSSSDPLDAAAIEQQARIEAAQGAIKEAELLVKMESFTDATSLLNSASASLRNNTATAATLQAIEAAKAEVIFGEVEALAEAGDLRGAETRLADYVAAGGNERKAASLARQLNSEISDPYDQKIETVSPLYVAQAKIIRDLLTRGRAQFLNGDYDGASATFKEVEARDANNTEAKLFQTRIANVLGEAHSQNLYKTRAQMLTEVDQQWERPKVFDITATSAPTVDVSRRIQEKLNFIMIPQVNFTGMSLTDVIKNLSELSVVYDTTEQVGVNIIPLFNPNDTNPRVNISLRNLSLDRVLQFVTQQVNFAYDVTADAVTIQPSDSLGGNSTTATEFFPISRATVIRLTGFRDSGGSGGGVVDPFAPAPASGGGASGNDETQGMQNFFQRAGVNFDLPGTSIAFDGEQLIVTQTRRNLERMRTILRNYNEVKQVEIEAKFLEVSQNDLDEVGFDWVVSDGTNRVFDTRNRQLSDPFTVNQSVSQISINRPQEFQRDIFGDIVGETEALNTNVPIAPPTLSTNIDLADSVGNLFTATGWTVNGYDVDFAIRALSRKSGSDLMSAPKITVLSGKRAKIVVAQELRYPESYGDIQSTVSSGRNSADDSGGGGGTGNPAISIVAGTPQDFVVRNVGVELEVTPSVANDDTISLILEPRVTEFEGFVEYGGPSVALAGNTTVTVPSGFFQPVFSSRSLSTEVTVFDGATVVLGGLTRDEVKSINDKVPVLGDIPGIGRLFRSEGETRQKRNLMIFVTANLVSPGGSPARQSYRSLNANSLFQNPTIMTPSGSVNRSIDSATSE